ncbi:MAG: sugar translocase [Clostridia bacterium]|nr:sugar translocase [Clostridia bacterium]
MEKSRTKNSIKNFKTGMIMEILNKIMIFIVRTVFIKTLNIEYLGVNGLFTNILTILSFAELGIGTAIIFNMYKPVANNDIIKIKSYMNLYKKSYTIIGIIVFLLGLLVLPFMGVLIEDAPNINENINFIYILFLINTSISYFYIYKKSIISAYQQERVINNITSIFYLLKSIFEILFLLITKNYIIYLILEIIFTLLQNISISLKADKMFPFLKEQSDENLSKEEKVSIFKNVKALIVYKFGSIIMFGTDNIILTTMINVSTVGLCSNYTMIINSVKSIILAALNGITASVGNLNASNDNIKKKDIFYQITFINFWIFGFCAVALIVLLNPFIEIWLGKKYIMDFGISIALAISFFIEGMRNPCYTYRITLGLFEKGKITPYIGTIANITLSILLCRKFGAIGIFIATSIAQLVSYSWIDPYLIHKYAFKSSVIKYIKKYLIYCVVFVFSIIVTKFIVRFIEIAGLLGIIVKGLIVLVIPNLIYLISFYKTEEFRNLKNSFSNQLAKSDK